MKKIISSLLFLLSISSFAVEDGQVLHSNELIKEAKVLLDSGNIQDLYMASSMISVLKMQDPDDSEVQKLEQIIKKKIKESRNRKNMK